MHYGFYGQEIGTHLGIPSPPFLRTTSLKSDQIAMTRIASPDREDGQRAGGPVPQFLDLPLESAVLVALGLGPIANQRVLRSYEQIWEGSMASGASTLLDMQAGFRLSLEGPYDLIVFYLPKIAIAEIAGANGVGTLGHIDFVPRMEDETVYALARALLPACAGTSRFASFIVNHAMTALVLHLCGRFGRPDEETDAQGGLSSAQLHSAKGLLKAAMTGGDRIADVAKACDMSAARFARAFRISTGQHPAQWLREFRASAAVNLVRESGLALSEIAYACGYSDQSHMTRAIASLCGITPGAIRSGEKCPEQRPGVAFSGRSATVTLNNRLDRRNGTRNGQSVHVFDKTSQAG